MFKTKCGAKARTNDHKPCRQPAMANGRCRLHGGKVVGPKTEEGRQRQKMGSWKHGMRSKEVIEETKELRDSMRQAAQFIGDVWDL